MEEHLQLCLDMVTHSEAQEICLLNGSLWLPMSQAELDGVYQQLLEKSIHSLWMPVKRADLKDYMWIDNKRHSKSDWNISIILMNTLSSYCGSFPVPAYVSINP